jgi:membrane-bound acyltransferase YfiQ involved in biofilm formation
MFKLIAILAIIISGYIIVRMFSFIGAEKESTAVKVLAIIMVVVCAVYICDCIMYLEKIREMHEMIDTSLEGLKKFLKE